MDLNELKALVSRLGSLVLIEAGKPSLVVVDFDHYQKLLGEPVASEGESALVEKLNRDITLLKEEIGRREMQELSADTLIDSEEKE